MKMEKLNIIYADLVEEAQLEMDKNHLTKRRRRRCRKVMASLTGAALLSSAVLGAPTAKAAEPIKTEKSDIVSDVLLNSREKIQEKIQEKAVEKIAESLENLKNNPEIAQEAWQRSKDFIEAKVRETVEAKVAEKSAELADGLSEWLKPKKEQAHKVMNIKATAYTSGKEDNGIWDDKTHIGTKVRPGIIAVDPKVIPLGSKVYIEFPTGKGMYAVAEDTGGAIKGNRIDIALENRDKVTEFGIQDVKVHLMEVGSIKV